MDGCGPFGSGGSWDRFAARSGNGDLCPSLAILFPAAFFSICNVAPISALCPAVPPVISVFFSSLRFFFTFFFFCFGRAPPTPAPQRMSPLLLVGRCISSGKLPLGLQAFPFGFLGVLGELSSSPPNLVPGVSIFFLPFFSRRQPWGKRNAASVGN